MVGLNYEEEIYTLKDVPVGYIKQGANNTMLILPRVLIRLDELATYRRQAPEEENARNTFAGNW